MVDGERQVGRWRGMVVGGRGKHGRWVGGEAGQYGGVQTGRGAARDAGRRVSGQAGRKKVSL